MKPSIQTDQRVLYFIKNADGKYVYVNKQEEEISPITDKEEVLNIVYPHTDSENRIIYSISYENLQERIQNTVRSILLLLFIISILGIFVAVLFASKIISPIRRLTRGVLEIARGNLKYKVHVETQDELRVLGDSFNRMARDLDVSRQFIDFVLSPYGKGVYEKYGYISSREKAKEFSSNGSIGGEYRLSKEYYDALKEIMAK